LNPEQEAIVTKHVSGHLVWDIGSGDLALASKLMDLGATRIIAVDKEEGIPKNSTLDIVTVDAIDPTILTYHMDTHIQGVLLNRLFSECDDPKTISFLSWPPNGPNGLLTVVQTTEVIIYLGKCTDGSMCGEPEMWRELRTREILNISPDRRNTLIVYGPNKVERRPVLEEIAGIDESRIYEFDEWVPTQWERL